MEIKDYIEIRRTIAIEEVSFGGTTVNLFAEGELEEGQLGYSRGASGEDFTGTGEGDWKTNWLVIGYEDLCGDPIFLDLKDINLPVYTAIHGQGRWDPIGISISLEGFIEALTIVDRVSEGRKNPVALVHNSLSQSEEDESLASIESAVGSVSLEFWKCWFRIYN